jgi:hypothetical protein
MEVVEAPDGSGPLFRARPRGGAWVSAASATRCWALLLGGDQVSRARAVQSSGPRVFGLSVPLVRRLIEALPGASRCVGGGWAGAPQGGGWLGRAMPPLAGRAWLHPAGARGCSRRASLCAHLRPPAPPTGSFPPFLCPPGANATAAGRVSRRRSRRCRRRRRALATRCGRGCSACQRGWRRSRRCGAWWAAATCAARRPSTTTTCCWSATGGRRAAARCCLVLARLARLARLAGGLPAAGWPGGWLVGPCGRSPGLPRHRPSRRHARAPPHPPTHPPPHAHPHPCRAAAARWCTWPATACAPPPTAAYGCATPAAWAWRAPRRPARCARWRAAPS